MIETELIVTRSLEAPHVEVNAKTGVVRAIISDDSTDRFNTVFSPDGARWDGWLAGGANVLYEHGNAPERGRMPVGNVVEGPELTTFRGRRSILTGTRFHDDDEFSRQIGNRYRERKMRSWSIAANNMTIQASPPTREELRARPDWGDAETVFRSWELVELSVVSVAGNANANTTEVLRHFGGPSRGRRTTFRMVPGVPLWMAEPEDPKQQTTVERSGLPVPATALPRPPAGASEADIRAFARDWNAMLTRAAQEIVGRLDGPVEDMSDDELRRLIARLGLEFKAHHWKGLHKDREKREAIQDECEAVAWMKKQGWR